jgi:23S rRNA (cytosine1962-C5)-methyltransferase
VEKMLEPSNSFLVMNMYALGLSSVVSDTLTASVFGNPHNRESGELILEDSFGKKLPLSVFTRFMR